jgi:hypothetical protein
MLAQLFRFILHPKQGQLRYPDLDTAALEKIPLAAFLKELTSTPYKSSDLRCPSLRDVMHCGGAHCVSMLFAMPDICLLAKVLPHTEFPAARRIPVDRRIDSEFFHYEIDPAALLHSAPDPPPAPSAVPPTALDAAARGLYRFLTHAKEEPSAPDDLAQFLRHHEKAAVPAAASISRGTPISTT